MNLENHMVMPFADDGAEDLQVCARHQVKYVSRCRACLDEEIEYQSVLRREDEEDRK